MAVDYKPLVLRKFSLLTEEERDEEFRLIEEYAEREGRSISEVYRVAAVRRKFAEMGKGEFYDQKLVESREMGEPFMDFINRMIETYRTH